MLDIVYLSRLRAEVRQSTGALRDRARAVMNHQDKWSVPRSLGASYHLPLGCGREGEAIE